MPSKTFAGPTFGVSVGAATGGGGSTASVYGAGGSASIPPPNLTGVVPAPPAQPSVPSGAPGQVQGLTVTYGPGGPGTFPATLSWQPVAGASYYQLHMLTDAEAIGAPYGLEIDPSQVNGIWGYYWQIGGTSAQITAPGGTMIFEVAACNAAGCGPWSQRIQVQVPPSEGPVLGP